jgi:biotin carboxyl carrier protein
MYKFKINGKSYEAEVKSEENGVWEIELNGKVFNVEVEEEERVAPTVIAQAVPVSQPIASAAPKVVEKAPVASGGSNNINSPLPGVVLDIKVNVGDAVKKGDVVMVLEAMKMENNIESLYDGVVSRIVKGKGDTVMEGETLIVLE